MEWAKEAHLKENVKILIICLQNIESHFEILTEKLMPLLEKNFGWSPECRLKKERCEYTGYSSEEARAVVQVRLRGFIQKQRVGERVNGNSPGSTELAVWA